MRKIVLGALGAAQLAQMLFFPSHDGTSQAIAPLIVAALISAAAAAAGGIASAAGQGAAADAQTKLSEQQRAAQERIAKMQLAESQRQFNANQNMQAQQAVGAAYQNQANVGLDRGAERNKSRQNLMNSLSRLMG